MNNLTTTVQNVFNTLSPQWRQKLLELSVFEASFDVNAAKAVWGEDTVPSTLLDLRYLKSCHLISLDDYYSKLGADDVQKLNIYSHESSHVQISLHSITKQFLQEESEANPEAMNDATQRFYTYIEDELVKIGQLAAETSILQAHKKADHVSAHIEKCLKSDDFISRSLTMTEKGMYDRDCMYAVLEKFMITKNRSAFFQQRAASAEGRNLTEFLHCKLWEAEQYIDSVTFHKVEKILAMVREKLKDLDSENTTEMVKKAVLAKYHYVNGRFLSIHEKKYSTAIQELIKSQGLYTEIGHKGMFLARTVNMLGSVYFDLNDYDNSIKYHEDAYQIMLAVMPSGHHFDMPTYVLNVGTAYHLKANKMKEKAHQLPDEVSKFIYP